VAELAKQFVCVRVQSMNGQNIQLFQFESDLTWMAFFLDAQDRIYARYGGRDDSDAESYLTQKSLVKVMRDVLALHKTGAIQSSRHEPAATPFRSPEEIPRLRQRLAARKAGQHCIHCHDVKMAELEHHQQLGTFAKEMIFTYPPPSTVGLEVDPDEQNRVRVVKPESPAARAGLRPGDVLQKLDGQRLLSVADLARVLELAPAEARLLLELQRDGRTVRTALALQGDWRRTADPSWRASVYVAGPNAGFWAVPLSDDEKRKAGISAENLALRVSFLFPGQATPVKAGLRLDDVVIELDGLRRPLTARQLHAHCQMNHTYGDKVPLVILRGGQEMKLTLELPGRPGQLK
jgi:predicted metalloprotease with PDZ domain